MAEPCSGGACRFEVGHLRVIASLDGAVADVADGPGRQSALRYARPEGCGPAVPEWGRRRS